MIQEGDVVINVVDATNLERNLYLTMELLEKGIPVVMALNMWDDTRHRGITVDVAKLESLLGVPVVPTVAASGQGIKELVERIPAASSPKPAPRTQDERWVAVGNVVREAQTLAHRHHTWLERLADASIKPRTGIPIAVFVLVLAFLAIRAAGEGLINYVTTPLFEKLWAPLMMRLSDALGSGGFWHDVLVGRLLDGSIDFSQSMGVLTTGLYIEFAIVLPYILIFYLVLGLMEDIGYLPRLAVLLDSIMHRLGMHGADGHPHSGEQTGAVYSSHSYLYSYTMRRRSSYDLWTGGSGRLAVCSSGFRRALCRMAAAGIYIEPCR
jgi:ferrous iron transport protein B